MSDDSLSTPVDAADAAPHADTSGRDAAAGLARLRAIQDRQRAFFEAGHTLPRGFREAQLRALMAALQRYEGKILEAVHADLRKPAFEAWAAEVGLTITEIRHALAHLKAWMKPSRRLAPIGSQPGRTAIHPQPLGLNLIVGAWNYPVQLTLAPLVAALAAGNVAVVKPSELAPASSALLAELIGATFAPEVVAAVEGGPEVATALLQLEWDHLFFTGGTRIGRIYARAAAETLSRCTLELGGKSPALVTRHANLHVAARRIAWGKWMNAGQTCVAPDYVLVEDAVHDRFVEGLIATLRRFYGDDPQRSPDFARVVNDRHLQRLAALLDAQRAVSTVAAGGEVDAADRYLAPTILTGVTLDQPIMADEIFGPILPIVRVSAFEDMIRLVRRNANPLALYLFSDDEAEQTAVVERVSFGGGAINNTMLHMTDPDAPFGGVRGSGLGAYHGKAGFDAFTHYKTVLESGSSSLLDLPVKYPPYKGKLNKVKWLLG